MVTRSVLEQTGQLDHWGDYIPKSKTRDTDASAVQTCWLNQFSALKVSGPDAERFLQGQLTCDVSGITTHSAHYGACCTAKGRIVANFNISFDGESYWLVMPSSSAEILEKHLQKYKVFFKANIDNCQQSHLIFGQWNTSEAGTAIHQKDQHELTLSPNRSFIVVNADNAQEHDLKPTLQWRNADITEGIYYVEENQTEQWIPQHINWHLLEGISFSKGCYTGQEIIARLQYLGKAKKALYHYQSLSVEGIPNERLSTQHIYNEEGKPQADVLILRSLMQSNNPATSTLDLLVVGHGESPPEMLYFTESMDFPLTLQNLPYTVEKDV